MKNIRIFYLKFFNFLVEKFSIYLNRHVFVMSWPATQCVNSIDSAKTAPLCYNGYFPILRLILFVFL